MKPSRRERKILQVWPVRNSVKEIFSLFRTPLLQLALKLGTSISLSSTDISKMAYSFLTVLVVVAFLASSISRSVAVVKNYKAPVDVFTNFSKRELQNGEGPRNAPAAFRNSKSCHRHEITLCGELSSQVRRTERIISSMSLFGCRVDMFRFLSG